MHTYIHTCIDAQAAARGARLLNACGGPLLYIHTHTCIHTYTHTHTYIVCIYVYTYVCMYR